MTKFYTVFVLTILVANSAYSQTLWKCEMQTPDTIVQTQMVNVTQPLVIIYVDFKDGRVAYGNAPTVDADTAYHGLNIDAVGSMGYTDPRLNPVKKKIRKYVYEDYWNMVFSNNVYIGGVHPDSSTHQGYTPPEGGGAYDLTVYGSVRDYWDETSNGNLLIQDTTTHTSQPHYGTGNMYTTGIVNRIDTANGKNYIRWITLDSVKNKYARDFDGVNTFDPIAAVKNKVIALHQNPSDPNYIEFDYVHYSGKVGIVIAGGIRNNAGQIISGYAFVGGQEYIVSEKMAYLGNTTPSSIMGPIAEHAHEFGHTIGFKHQAFGSYDLMFWGGFGDRRYYFCPPHINPWAKLVSGWIPASQILPLSVTTPTPVTLWAITSTSSSPKIALVTVYGDAGRNLSTDPRINYGHSEYFIIEYRKREKFNRFAGGADPINGFNGGALIWHYSNYGGFPIVGGLSGKLGIKIADYNTYHYAPDGSKVYELQGNAGSPAHFFTITALYYRNKVRNQTANRQRT